MNGQWKYVDTNIGKVIATATKNNFYKELEFNESNDMWVLNIGENSTLHDQAYTEIKITYQNRKDLTYETIGIVNSGKDGAEGNGVQSITTMYFAATKLNVYPEIDSEISNYENIIFNRSNCRIKPEYDSGKKDDTGYYALSQSIQPVASMTDDDINNYKAPEHELFHYYDYTTDPSGNECLCLLGLLFNPEDENGNIIVDGIDNSAKYFYKGIIEVDGKKYDYWQKAEDGNYEIYIDYTSTIYFLTERIVDIDIFQWQSDPSEAIISKHKPYLYSYTSIKYTNGDITNSEVTLIGTYGKDGVSGKPGKTVYPAGEYEVDKVYTSTETTTPYVMYEDTYYQLNVDEWCGEENGGTNPYDDIEAGNTNWIKFEQYEAIFAKVGMIDNGTFGAAVFSGDYMFSQYGINQDGKEIITNDGYKNFNPEEPYNPNNKFRPNTCFNFLTGETWLSGGKIHFNRDGSGNFINDTFSWDTTGNVNILGTLKITNDNNEIEAIINGSNDFPNYIHGKKILACGIPNTTVDNNTDLKERIKEANTTLSEDGYLETTKINVKSGRIGPFTIDNNTFQAGKFNYAVNDTKFQQSILAMYDGGDKNNHYNRPGFCFSDTYTDTFYNSIINTQITISSKDTIKTHEVRDSYDEYNTGYAYINYKNGLYCSVGLSQDEQESTTTNMYEYVAAIHTSCRGNKNICKDFFSIYASDGMFAGLRPRTRVITNTSDIDLDDKDYTIIINMNNKTVNITTPMWPKEGQTYEIYVCHNTTVLNIDFYGEPAYSFIAGQNITSDTFNAGNNKRRRHITLMYAGGQWWENYRDLY
jgi:hypothetical protein